MDGDKTLENRELERWERVWKYVILIRKRKENRCFVWKVCDVVGNSITGNKQKLERCLCNFEGGQKVRLQSIGIKNSCTFED